MSLAPAVNSLLANLRWICLPSENLGQDWFDRSRQIDALLFEEGMDLSEECTYLIFSEEPSEILDGNGQCLIARPVIGPKKELVPPFKLIDWKAAPVWRHTLEGVTLTELLMATEEARQKAVKGHKPFAQPFYLCVRRNLSPGLFLSVEAIFHE